MNLFLTDKVVIITGGTGSVGIALTHAFLREGSNIIILDKSKARMDGLIDRLGKNKHKVDYYDVDLSDPSEINKTFDEITKKYTNIDILINNAGIFSNTPILEISHLDWDKIFNTNLRSALLCSQRVLPSMINNKSGVIINIGSLGGQVGGIFAGAHYSASKAGMISLTKSLAKTFGKNATIFRRGKKENKQNSRSFLLQIFLPKHK